jgi:hypothetical protein
MRSSIRTGSITPTTRARPPAHLFWNWPRPTVLDPRTSRPRHVLSSFITAPSIFGDTLFRDIRRMDPERILRIEPSGMIHSMTRILRDLGAPPAHKMSARSPSEIIRRCK